MYVDEKFIAGSAADRGCQMVYIIHTKRRALEWKILSYFMAIFNILWPFLIFYGHF
jgi:hypothetical protein